MEIKKTLRNQFSPIRLAKISSLTAYSVGEALGKYSHAFLLGVQIVETLGSETWQN